MSNLIEIKEIDRKNQVENILEFLGIFLENELIGIPLKKVIEITKIRDIVPVPFSKPYIKGVINIRGEIIPVVSLKEKLLLQETKEANRIIIMETPLEKVSILVDDIYGVIKVKENDLEPNPMRGRYSIFVKNVAQVEDKLLIVIDIDKLFEKP